MRGAHGTTERVSLLYIVIYTLYLFKHHQKWTRTYKPRSCSPRCRSCCMAPALKSLGSRLSCVRAYRGSSTLNRGRVRLQRKRGSSHTSSWHAPQHNQERRIVMDPTTVFCPNLACPARGQTGQGNIGIHSQKEQRFICHACRKTFSATKGTAFYRLRTAAETVALVVTLLAHGCPVQAIVAAFGCDERTVAAWWARSGRQGQAVQECLVEQPRD